VVVNKKLFVKKFDLLVIISIIIASLLIVLFQWKGNSSIFQVSNFSWQNRTISSLDRQFTIDFDRPVDRRQIEGSLQIQPPLKGTVSWSGNRLFYTLTEIPLAETNFKIKLLGNKTIESFNGNFKTRDRLFAYLGIDEEESGKVVLYNYTQKRKTILTPKDLVVTEFRVIAGGAKVIFFAYDRNNLTEGLDRLQLYTVTTGIDASRLGSIDKIVDATEYQNIDFDVSADGNTVVIERLSRKNLREANLWLTAAGEQPRSLGIIGDSFRLSPDGKKLAVTQNSGVNLIDLNSLPIKTEFLKDYPEIVSFAPDSQRILLAKYNTDYSRSLSIVDLAANLAGKGRLIEIFRSFSSISSCQFEPRQQKTIYCIKNDLTVEDGQYRQTPFLTAINLETKQNIPLLSIPNSPEIRVTISPDGALLLFDRTIVSSVEQTQAITNGSIWRLPLLDIEATGKPAPPQQLGTGFYPQWLP
jgi:hypothetical protein